MKRSNSRLLAQSVLLLCLCLLLEVNEMQAQSDENRGPDTGRIMQIDPKGGLKIIQARGRKPVTAEVYMPVHKGNILILNPNTTASVVCGDGNRRKLEPGYHPCPCKDPCPPSICGSNSDRIMSARPTANKDLFPVVRSPRATLLMNLRPTIRWIAINGANENTIYKVIIYGENMEEIWTEVVRAKTSLAYPDNKPSLTPGQNYKVVITSEGRSSEEDHAPGLGFTTLKQKQAQELGRKEQKIKARGFPDMQTRFLISILYDSEGLYTEAIEQLEGLYNYAKEPVVARVLGNLYSAIGLGRDAEKYYLESLQRQDPEDLEGVALTQKELANIYEHLGIFDEAVRRLEEAIKAYDQLGNSVQVQVLKARTQNLKRKQ